MVADYLDTLRNEFEAGEGSFLTKLRVHLSWDEEAFLRLTSAMEACCEYTAGAEVLDRWLAEGFWYVSDFTRSWTTHENFRWRNPDVDYEQAYGRLYELAYWFFTGLHPSL